MRPPEFWNHRRGRDAAPVTRLVLTPLSWIYFLAGALKQAVASPYRARAKVICVGNLTLGGAGKTPVTLAILAKLKARGLKVAALTRGYRGKEAGPIFVSATHDATDVGDEALLLAKVAPTIVAHNRAAGARLADAEGFDVIVMDDGFQNPSLSKNLNIIVVDGETGFGNRSICPAGPLREPIKSGLSRASAILYMRRNEQALRNPAKGAEFWRGPVLNAWLEPEPDAAAGFKGERIVPFAGVGRPQKVFDTFEAIGANVIVDAPYPDHYHYTDGDIDWLRRLAKKHNARLATTEKDFMRLNAEQREGVSVLPVRAVFAVEPALDALLAPLIAQIERTRETVSAS